MKEMWFCDFGPLPEGLPELRNVVFYSCPQAPIGNAPKKILSSGTWGIASAGGFYKTRNWDRLYKYYKQFQNVGYPGWRMMPDEYLRPWKTMKNFQKWMESYPDLPVVPIIQSTKEKCFDLFTAKKQIQFYKQFSPNKICISNPAFFCHEWVEELTFIAMSIKDILNGPWIHVLGAGWDIGDIKQYARIEAIDSVDTIVYYTAAQRGEAWRCHISNSIPVKNLKCDCPACSSVIDGWQRIAMHNAFTAQEVIKNISSGE